jgi:hypothetical protein
LASCSATQAGTQQHFHGRYLQGWPIATGSPYTLDITLGAVAEKPGVIDRKMENREYLSATVSVDHDIMGIGHRADRLGVFSADGEQVRLLFQHVCPQQHRHS